MGKSFHPSQRIRVLVRLLEHDAALRIRESALPRDPEFVRVIVVYCRDLSQFHGILSPEIKPDHAFFIIRWRTIS